MKEDFPQDEGLRKKKLSFITLLRTRSDFEKNLTIKNFDKTFLKIILRLKKAEKKNAKKATTLAKRNHQVKICS